MIDNASPSGSESLANRPDAASTVNVLSSPIEPVSFIATGASFGSGVTESESSVLSGSFSSPDTVAVFV